MKTALILTALVAANAVSGCATGPSSSNVAAVTAGQTSFTGWVRVSRGEFQLFDEQRQLREAFSRPCVSGALPRNAQDAAGDLNGSQVTLTGRTAPWSGATNQVLEHQGSRIVNECRGELVILADDVRVLR
ncbi:MAG: hypothetical protein Q8S03_05935 [Brevundimonas sp.]|uniref:hypothetical protein n=1 Tax=Brevundimonas sp. TaxID=1871086 RepID=UPI002736A921|nr:hypothetical protein [Brevundimonas sp.]MDP3404211.1 hypothetical protein [Brevundimonas sp.]